ERLEAVLPPDILRGKRRHPDGAGGGNEQANLLQSSVHGWILLPGGSTVNVDRRRRRAGLHRLRGGNPVAWQDQADFGRAAARPTARTRALSEFGSNFDLADDGRIEGIEIFGRYPVFEMR